MSATHEVQPGMFFYPVTTLFGGNNAVITIIVITDGVITVYLVTSGMVWT
jgi:hypothetical protein